MSLRTWWEERQQKKHDHENEKLLDVAAHPEGSSRPAGPTSTR